MEVCAGQRVRHREGDSHRVILGVRVTSTKDGAGSLIFLRSLTESRPSGHYRLGLRGYAPMGMRYGVPMGMAGTCTNGCDRSSDTH